MINDADQPTDVCLSVCLYQSGLFIESVSE